MTPAPLPAAPARDGTADPAPPPRPQRAAAGEPWVWITGMGLGIGLLMVLGLLTLIVSNGLGVFWPGRVTELILAEGSAARVGAADRIAGEIRLERVKRVPGRAEATRPWPCC